MNRVFAILLALGLAAASFGPALAQDAAAPAPQVGKAFKTYDANGDGKVTKEEFLAAAQKRAEARWAKLDPSGKGYVTQDEMSALRAKAGEKAKARRAAKQAPAAQ